MARVYFLLFAALGAFAPHVSAYLQDQGLSAVQMSYVLVMPPILAIAVQPWWGVFADAQVRKNRVLAGLMFACVVAALLMHRVAGFLPILLAYTLLSVFSTALIPLADSMALGEAAATGHDFPKMRLWGSVAFMITSAALGWLYDRTAITALFYGYAAILAVAAVYVWRLPAMGSAGVGVRPSVWQGVRQLLGQRLLWVVLGLSFLNQVAYAAHNGFITVYLKDLGATNGLVGVNWALAALTEVPVFFLLGGWVRRFGKERLLVFACVVWALRFFWYAHMPSAEWALVNALLQGVSFGITYATAVMLVGEITPPEVRTSGQALLALINSGAASIVGLLLGGVLVRSLGIPGMYGVVQWFSGVAALGFLGVWWVRQRPGAVQPPQQEVA